jgi:hypothetical protein
VVDVWEQDRLRERWTDVLPGTAVTVSASTDFVVERTVDSVLLCTEDVGLRSGPQMSEKWTENMRESTHQM